MSHGSLEDALKVLRNRMSGRWDGVEADGRDAMVDALTSELGYSNAQAKSMIDGLAASGTIRYHRGQPDADTSTDTTRTDDAGDISPGLAAVAGAAGLGLGGAAGSGTGGIGSAAAAPLALGALGNGYWQIGDAGDSAGEEKAPMEGRAGQIDPTS